jgi:hypothetical protein
MSKPAMALILATLLAPSLGWGQQPVTFNVAHTNAVGRWRSQTTFNVVQHNVNMLASVGRSVFALEDGYLNFSVEWASDSATISLFIARTDPVGNLLWRKEHNVGRDLDPGVIDPITRVNDQFVAAITGFGGQSPNVTWLYWFNAEGDTIRTRFLKSDSNQVTGNHGTRQLIALADGGFLHCGWCAGHPPSTGGCITRLDSTGSILWVRNYPQAQYIFNATELSDGGFVLGGSRNTQQDMAVVIRTDSLGNAQWVRYHGLYALTGGSQAMIDDDGNVLMPGAWKDDPLWSVYDNWACLYKYSPTGTLLDRKDYYFSYEAGAGYILPKGTGHYWLVGGMYQYILNPDGVTTLWELDENLDSLWMRRYWYYEPDGAFSFPNSVRSTSDGGLVICGATRQGVTDPMPYLQSNWLLKLDEHGCLVPGCHTVGIDEHVLGLNDYLRIWPNPLPAGHALQFTFEPPPNLPPTGPLRVVLLDAQGRQIHEERVHAGASTPNTINIQPATGLYYLHLTDGTRWLAGGKVVVE